MLSGSGVLHYDEALSGRGLCSPAYPLQQTWPRSPWTQAFSACCCSTAIWELSSGVILVFLQGRAPSHAVKDSPPICPPFPFPRSRGAWLGYTHVSLCLCGVTGEGEHAAFVIFLPKVVIHSPNTLSHLRL